MEEVNGNGNIPELTNEDIDKNKNKIIYFMGAVKQSLKDIVSQNVEFKDKLDTLSMKIDDKIDSLSLTYNTLSQKVALSEKESELTKQTTDKQFNAVDKKVDELDGRTQRDYTRYNQFDQRLKTVESELKIDDKATNKSRNTINYLIVIAVFLMGIMQFYFSCQDKRVLDGFKQDLSSMQGKLK